MELAVLPTSRGHLPHMNAWPTPAAMSTSAKHVRGTQAALQAARLPVALAGRLAGVLRTRLPYKSASASGGARQPVWWHTS